MKPAGLLRPLLTMAALYYLLAVVGIYLSRQPGNIATLWFANALAVVALQMRPTRQWPISLLIIAAALLAANLSFGDPWLLSVSFLPGNLAEICLAAFLLKRFGHCEECLSDPLQLLKTLCIVAIIPSLLGAVLGGAVLAAYGFAPFERVWPAWAVGSVIGNISILPLGIVVLVRGLKFIRKRNDLLTLIAVNLFVVATALYAPIALPYPFVYLSAALIFAAVFGGVNALAIALPLSTMSWGLLIALGLFVPLPSASVYGDLVFYIPFAIALLTPLIAAVAFEKAELINAQLQTSERTYRDLYRKTPVMMHSLDVEGRIVSVSDAWLAKLGFVRDEVIGKVMITFLTPESQVKARTLVWPQLRQLGSVKDVDYQMVGKTGQVFDVRLSAIWEEDFKGNRIHTLAVVVDVTEEKRLEGILAAEKTRLAAVLDGTDAGSWQWDVESGETKFDDRWHTLLGYSPGDPAVTGISGWQSLVHPDDAELCQTLLDRHLSGDDERFSQELRLRHSQGSWIAVLARGKVSEISGDQKTRWMYGTHLEITDIKRAQQAAEEGRFFLERTGQIAGVGSWSVDLRSQRIVWSAQTCRIQDVPVGHCPTMEEAVGYYLPESRARVEAALQASLATRQGWDLELQMVTATGRRIWVRDVGEVECDASGQPARVLGTFQDITSRKASEAELNRLNALLRSVLQSASEISIIATDVNGLIQIFNTGAERLLGYSALEMVGKETPGLLHDAQEVAVRAQELSQELGANIEGFRVFVHLPELHGAEARQWTYVRKDGTRVPVWLVVTAMRDDAGAVVGYLGIATDISQRLEHQRALAAAAEQLHLAIEVAEMGIWTWELANNQLHWNDRMFAIYDQPLDLKEGGLVYAHWQSRVHPDDVKATEASLLAAVEGTGNYDPMFRIVLPDGRVRQIQAGARVERDTQGQALRVIGFNRDMTDQWLLESSLRNAKEQADLASGSKSSFLANMSHEIRTPMNAVLGMLQLVQQTDLNTRQQDYINKTQVAAKSLLGLLNDILDFSKVEAGKLELDPHPFELEHLLRDLAVVLSGNVGQKEVELLFEVDPSLPRVLMADKLRLQQILINLAGNAIKFTPQGEVVISIRRLSSTDDSVTVNVAVRDSGIGIEASQLEKIFDGFSQAEASTTRRFGGTGLGLAISSRLVEIMGGDLVVSSEIGKGSLFSFSVTLPVADDIPMVQAAAALSPLRILVVDDNPVAREVLVAYCHGLGLYAEEAASGKEAISRYVGAAQAGHRYDVVLMDWRMPEMDGMVAAQKISEISGPGKPPIILMVTAYGREALQQSQDTARAPFFDLLTKPLTPSQLGEALSRAFSGAQVEPAQMKQQTKTQQLSGLKLLVVEDNALNRQVAFELLSSEGANVSLAHGGLQGVEMACDGSRHFDLVLMDIQMPDIDGLEATRRIRQLRTKAQLPILAMTANASAADREACLAAGMDEHVGKPIDMDQLIPAILGLVAAPRIPVAVVDQQSVSDIDARLATVLKRFSGNRSLLGATLDAFVPEGQKLIEMALAANSTKAQLLALHTLKGIAATVGAVSLSQLAARIEGDIKQNNGDGLLLREEDVVELRRLLTAEIAELLAAFNGSELTDKSAKATLAHGLPRQVLQERLQAILPLLDGKRMQAVDKMEALMAETSGTDKQSLQPLASRIEQLDFNGASQILHNLLGKMAER